MQFRSLSTAALVLVLSNAAHAQISAATSSSFWTARPRSQRAPNVYSYHDGTTENALGLTAGGELAWFQGFSNPSDTIVSVSSSNGWSGGGGLGGAPAGSVGGVYVYDDPGGDDTNPTDLMAADLLGTATWTVVNVDADILETTAVPPSVVSNGFWIAASLPHAAGRFPAPMDVSTAPSNSHSWVTGDGVAFDPNTPGGGIGFFEMASLGFDSHWLLSGCGTGGGITTYCTAKSGLVCGLPAIGFAGVPQAGATSGFKVTAAPARGNRTGLVLYSCAGRANFPFQGGILCVNPAPLRRTTIIGSGGTNGACDGVFGIDFNSFATGGLGGNPDACLGVSGQQVNTQVWGRDSVATGSFLSDALEFNM